VSVSFSATSRFSGLVSSNACSSVSEYVPNHSGDCLLPREACARAVMTAGSWRVLWFGASTDLVTTVAMSGTVAAAAASRRLRGALGLRGAVAGAISTARRARSASIGNDDKPGAVQPLRSSRSSAPNGLPKETALLARLMNPHRHASAIRGMIGRPSTELAVGAVERRSGICVSWGEPLPCLLRDPS
jgi:hypothetical protein